jgi:predicted phosphodiesterase
MEVQIDEILKDWQAHRAAELRLVARVPCQDESSWQERFFFINMADCQLGFEHHNVSWEEEKGKLRQAVALINSLQPLFVILCGDMTHARPGEDRYVAQVADYKEVVAGIDSSIPLVCVCGNHDVGDRPTAQTLEAYRDNFGKSHFSFWARNAHCLVINSSLMIDPSGASAYQEAQEAWLIGEMERAHTELARHRFVFMHHSLFLTQADEEDSHFNFPKKLRFRMLELFAAMGVEACFSGHYHRNAGGTYKEMAVITTGAIGKPLGIDPSGVRIVEVTDEKVKHGYLPLDYS